ncbi:MAG: DUF4270 family protein, partial [Bacteroidales bacterium]|nr:DUF4270 family protein [Bacteroidales bacterium]
QSNEYEDLASQELSFGSDSVIKIDLPSNLISEIVNYSTSLDNDQFVALFNGLYITTEVNSGSGCIYCLDLIGSKSKMVLSYTKDGAEKSYDFVISDNSARINMYYHDYSSANQDLQNALEDTTKPYKQCYIQGLGGLKTKIKFPELTSIFDSTNIIINRAQIQFSVNTEFEDDKYPLPNAMSMTRILDSGLFDFLEDYKSNSKYFGGKLDKDTKTYTFNIPLHLQGLQQGQNDNGIYMVANDNRIYPYRAVLNNGIENVKVIIYYSKY